MACFKGFAELHNMQPFADTAFLLSLSEPQSMTGIRHHDAGSTTGLSVTRPRQIQANRPNIPTTSANQQPLCP